MPTITQLEQRLQRINAKLTGTAPGAPAAVRQLKKDRRRLQRKLRARRPASTPPPKPAAPAPAEAAATETAAAPPAAPTDPSDTLTEE